MPRIIDVEGVLLSVCSSWIPLLNFLKWRNRLSRCHSGLKVWEVVFLHLYFLSLLQNFDRQLVEKILLMLGQVYLFCRITTLSLWTISLASTISSESRSPVQFSIVPSNLTDICSKGPRTHDYNRTKIGRSSYKHRSSSRAAFHPTTCFKTAKARTHSHSVGALFCVLSTRNPRSHFQQNLNQSW